MLQIRNLQCGYEDIVAVHDLSFEAAAGEVFALIGANGAGKTTTIMALAGHVAPMRGSILVEGQDISSEKAQGRLSHGIALVPEGRRVFPDLSVESNLTVGGHTVGREALRSNRENAYQIFRAADPASRIFVRGRTADAGYCPRHDGQPKDSACGRTFPWVDA